jgi:hypothetical protein
METLQIHYFFQERKRNLYDTFFSYIHTYMAVGSNLRVVGSNKRGGGLGGPGVSKSTFFTVALPRNPSKQQN